MKKKEKNNALSTLCLGSPTAGELSRADFVFYFSLTGIDGERHMRNERSRVESIQSSIVWSLRKCTTETRPIAAGYFSDAIIRKHGNI